MNELVPGISNVDWYWLLDRMYDITESRFEKLRTLSSGKAKSFDSYLLFVSECKNILKDRNKSLSKKYYEENKEKVFAHARNRRAKIKGIGGKVSAKEWRDLKAYYGFSCLKCGQREPEIKLTQDHVIPISKGGSHSIDNIQPLCVSCNCSKGSNAQDYRKQGNC